MEKIIRPVWEPEPPAGPPPAEAIANAKATPEQRDKIRDFTASLDACRLLNALGQAVTGEKRAYANRNDLAALRGK